MIHKRFIIIILIEILLFTKVKSQKYDAEVVNYSTISEIVKDNLTEVDSVTIQVNNRTGDKYANIEIPFSNNDKLSDVCGNIETKDGIKIRILKKKDQVDESDISRFSVYEDNFKRCFQLKYNVYPYRINYSYKKTFRNYITIGRWCPVIDRQVPTRNSIFKVILPANYKYVKYERNIIRCLKDSTDKNIIIVWKAMYDKPLKEEPFSSTFNDFPLVLLSPMSFKYGVEGSSKDWNSFGNWQFRLMQGLDILPEDEKTKIKSLINGITDKRDIIKILYHYLQDHTRYVNVSIGLGGLKPYPAAYVAHNKYGDCKALTNYMKAMLHFAGIESNYTLVYADEQPLDLIKEIPCPQFNHVILAVPLDNDTIWLENTSNINPFGYLGTYTQNRYALLISKDNSHIVKIPALTKYDNLNSQKIEFDLDKTGFATLTLNSTFRGMLFDIFNSINYEFNEHDKNKIIHTIMPFENYEIKDWKIVKQHRDSAKITLYTSLIINKFLNPLGKDLYFTTYSITIPKFTAPAIRKLPVVLPYPIYNIDTLIFNIPKGYEVKSVPENALIKTNFGEFRTNYSSESDRIIEIKSFELYPNHYTQDDYPDFYKFIKKSEDSDYKAIEIKPK